MTCQEATELLPWLLNGSLESAERERVQAHLEGCAGCRRELDETRAAAEVFAAHIPTAWLVDHAQDRRVEGIPGRLLEAHLEACADCADQLALARESRRLSATGPTPRRPLALPWTASLAAGIVAALAAGAWLGGARGREAGRAARAEGERLRERVAAIEEEGRRAQEAGAELRRRVARLASPQLNVPVLEVSPRGSVLRGGTPTANDLLVPSGAAWLTLVLNSEARAVATVLEVRDARDAVVWTGEGLERSRLGIYTINLPAELLPDGTYTIDLLAPTSGRRAAIERYPIRVRRAR